MRVALLANLKQNAPPADGSDSWDDLDGQATIDGIVEALSKGGHEAEFFEARIDPPFSLLDRLERFAPDLCFNIAEGHFGESRESEVPALLDMLRIPYTGSSVLTLALALDKPMTKRVLHYHELPSPEFQVFGSKDEEINDDLLSGDELRFPLFLKPSREGTGMGISGDNIVESVSDLRELLSMLFDRYHQPILCERFVQGREITIGLIGNLGPTAARRLNDRTAPAVLPDELRFFPPLEVNMADYDESEKGVYTNRIKVELAHEFHWTCPADVDAPLADELSRYAAATFRVTGCHDVARIDFRVDEADGRPYILEINPLPGLNEEYSDLCIEARADGVSYTDLINGIVEIAAVRHGLNVSEESQGRRR